VHTLASANALIPSVIPKLERLRTDFRELQRMNALLHRQAEWMRPRGFGLTAHRLEPQIRTATGRMKSLLGELTADGVEVKDFETGLIDFLAEHDGRLVYLCWRLGESTIAFWHDLDAGFAGRQMIDRDEWEME
jgi:hypothetical protein